MTILRMPLLEDGRVYSRDEVAGYIGSHCGKCEYDFVLLGFPRDICDWELGLDHDRYRAGEAMVLQYRVFAIAEFIDQLREKKKRYQARAGEWQRVRETVERLSRGEPVYPVYLQQNDPLKRIIEGNHKAVALLELGSQQLPAFVTGYRDWFIQDR